MNRKRPLAYQTRALPAELFSYISKPNLHRARIAFAPARLTSQLLLGGIEQYLSNFPYISVPLEPGPLRTVPRLAYIAATSCSSTLYGGHQNKFFCESPTMEPSVGIEPTTTRLQGECSTVEPTRHNMRGF